MWWSIFMYTYHMRLKWADLFNTGGCIYLKGMWFSFTYHLGLLKRSLFATHYINLWCRFLHHLKKKIGNKAHLEALICNACLTKEISNFCVVYFEQNIDTKTRDLGWNVYPNVEENGNTQTLEVLVKLVLDTLSNMSMT